MKVTSWDTVSGKSVPVVPTFPEDVALSLKCSYSFLGHHECPLRVLSFQAFLQTLTDGKSFCCFQSFQFRLDGRSAREKGCCNQHDGQQGAKAELRPAASGAADLFGHLSFILNYAYS